MEHHHQEWKPELRVNSSFAFKLPWQLFTLPLCWLQSDFWQMRWLHGRRSESWPTIWPHTDSMTATMTDPLIDPITDQNCEVKAVLHSCDVALHTTSPNDCNDPNCIIILMIIIIESGTDQNSCVQTSTDVTSLFPRMPSFIFPPISYFRQFHISANCLLGQSFISTIPFTTISIRHSWRYHALNWSCDF